MTPPDKIFLPNSALESAQYPSQSANFLSLDAGRSFKMQQTNKGRDSPYHLQRNQRESYRKSCNQYDYREDKKQFHNRRKNFEYDFLSYFHPSMLENPWESLLNRYKSLCASQISHPIAQRNQHISES